uniref:Uncharacterized protein n=1 Tax=Daphnia magna TaxID=35525 RepID=A0A0P6IRP1_9CRUS
MVYPIYRQCPISKQCIFLLHISRTNNPFEQKMIRLEKSNLYRRPSVASSNQMVYIRSATMCDSK